MATRSQQQGGAQADAKFCLRCDTIKLRDAFQKCSRNADGMQSHCRECRTAAAVEYRERTREQRLAYNREYYQAHRERIAAYYVSRRDELKAAMRARYAASDPEVEREKRRAWHVDNREHHNRYNKARRARIRDQFVEHVVELVVLERDDGVCGICGHDVDPFDFHVDHVVPVTRGGEHSYANVQVAHPSCNKRKSAMLPHEYVGVAV